MPELPEVETIVRGLRAHVEGRILRRAELRAPDLYRTGSERMSRLAGARIERIERMGKAIRISAVPPGGAARKALVVHLGMTGKLVVPRAGNDPLVLRGDAESGSARTRAQVLGQVDKHRHGRLVFSDGTEVWYVDPRRFGYFYLGDEEGVRERLNIGLDPFEIKPRALREKLAGRTAPVKSLLLNQNFVAGLGNIYVDETLFAARIHPLTPAGELVDRAGDLLTCARRVLRRAIRFGGTTLRDYRKHDGGTGSYQHKLSVYGRDGEPCPRCGAAVDRIVITARSTHFCPECQRR